jgi:hypothetical protein
MAAKFQVKFVEIQNMISTLPSDRVSKETSQMLIETIRKMSQDFNETQRKAQQAWDKERETHQKVNSQLFIAERQLEEVRKELNAAIQDRQHIIQERDSLQVKINELRLKTKTSMERMNEVEKKWKDLNSDLMERLRKQEEQLAGKRALWLQANPGSSARRDAMVAMREPYNTPTHGSFLTNNISSLGSPSDSNMQKNESKQPVKSFLGPPPVMKFPPNAPTGPSNKLARKPNLPTGRAEPSLIEAATMSAMHSRSSRPYTTEPPEETSMAMILHKDDTYVDPSPPYQAAFEELYEMIQGWVQRFSAHPNRESDRMIASGNQLLWEYMLNCTYPENVQDAHNHSQLLLNDINSRYWFVFRMIVQYCVKDIIGVKNFKCFSTEVYRIIHYVHDQLKVRGKLETIFYSRY